jgi:hypothetical protein
MITILEGATTAVIMAIWPMGDLMPDRKIARELPVLRGLPHRSAVEDVYADGSRYWWGEPIAGTADLLTAAHRVTAALCGSTPAGSRQ